MSLNVRMSRRLMFEWDINRGKDDRWQWRMLEAIETAKRLGFVHFAIDVAGDATPSEEVSEGVPYRNGGFLFVLEQQMGIAPTGEEWRVGDAKKEKRDRAPRIVRVWALAVEHADVMEATP